MVSTLESQAPYAKLSYGAALILIFAVGCTPAASPENPGWLPKDPPPLLSPEQTAQYRGCSADADCVYTQNGCCDCANGGQEVAVNAAKLSAFQAQFTCANVSCTERGRRPACGTGKALCRAGLCEFEAAAAD